jgi:hypothetical protein
VARLEQNMNPRHQAGKIRKVQHGYFEEEFDDNNM